MSRKQGPRAAGMRPSARAGGSLRSNGEPTGLLLAGVAAGRRYDVPENFPVFMRGGNMHSEQGPQACLGMRSPVHVVRVRLLPGDMDSLGHSLPGVGHGH